MTKTAQFSIDREQTLAELFTAERLVNIWRKIVKKQMRSMDIIDLHDYYDFNVTLKERASEISKLIIKAQYKADSPLIYKLEKSFGICRHLMLPSASDALVFQAIAEYLTPKIQSNQPTDKAYHSRDRATLKLPHEVSLPREPWYVLWPKYQKQILKFTNDCEYLAVTDIANYYDNIGLRELRNIVSSYAQPKEVILDFLFNIIEQISWVPDYLPTSLKGLPQINLEAFRLLPHVMLFDADKLLNIQTDGNFVRWMDDISFGTNSKNQAREILGYLNDSLKSRGLALNIAKTKIYGRQEAKIHFLFEENEYLNQIAKTSISSPNYKQNKKDFLKRFRKHLRNKGLRNWDRVTRRYFTVAGDLKIRDLLRYSTLLFTTYPNLRAHIIKYLYKMGYTAKTSRITLELLENTLRYDDVTLFYICKLITDLEVPYTNNGKEFIRKAERSLKNPKTELELYCYFWFLAKYGEPHIILNLIEQTKDLWKGNIFLSRQIVSILPRTLKLQENYTKSLIDQQARIGARDIAAVANNINMLIKVEKLSEHHVYLFPSRKQTSPILRTPYPLNKFLILIAIASSPNLLPAEKEKIRKKTKEHIKDKWYINWMTSVI
jgi:hypothetical protein